MSGILSLAVVFLALAIPSTSLAQVAGTTIPQSDAVPFSTAKQNIWAPAGIDPDALAVYWLFNDTWDEGDSTTGIQNVSTIFGNQQFGGSISGSTSGRVGMNFSISGLSESWIDVNYPVEITIDVPQANSFRAGEPVTIPTSWRPTEGGDFTPDVEPLVMSIGGAFGYSASADFDVCVFSCAGKQNFFPPFTIEESEFEMLRIGDPSWLLDTEDGQISLNTFFFLGEFITGVDGFVQRPEPFAGADVTVDGTKLTTGGSGEFFGMGMDIDAFLAFTGGIPWYVSLGEDFDLTRFDVGVNLGYNLADLRTDMVFSQHDEIEFDARPDIRVDLGQPIQWWVTDPATSSTHSSGTSSAIVFPAGMDLTVVLPNTTPITPETAYNLPNTFSHNSHIEVSGEFVHKDLTLDIVLPGHSFTLNRDEDKGSYKKKSCPSVTSDPVGAAQCEIEHAWSVVKRASSSWWKWVKNIVSVAYNYAFQPKNVELGPVYEVEFGNWGETVGLVDASWTLGGFGQPGGSSFTLDPEDPSIALSMDVANGLLSGGANGTVIQSMTATNTGDVPLSTVQITESLTAQMASAGLTVVDVSSGDFMLGSFNGDADDALLDGFDVLDPGESGSLQVTLGITPGYGVTLDANSAGISPIGTDVSGSAFASFAFGAMDVKQKSLKAKHALGDDEGTLQVYLFGSADLKVADLDRGSLRLEGVSPKVSRKSEKSGKSDKSGKSLKDKNRDGYPDLRLKFSRRDVIIALLNRLQTGAPVQVNNTGGLRADEESNAEFEAPTLDLLLRAVLGGAEVDPLELRSIDRNGNANGRVDLGDLRARVLADEGISVVAWTTADGRASGKAGRRSKKSKKSEKSNNSSKEEGQIEFLVLSGALTDGTPFWAEDYITLVGN
jgi:hypothetical protein